MSNVVQLSTLRAARALPPENVRSCESSFRPRQLPVTGPGRRRSAASMHTYLFRSYDLILASSEADLARDVGCDIHKAASKLHSIRQQIQRDREHAAAREALLTRAEAKLSAAVAAVCSGRAAAMSTIVTAEIHRILAERDQ